jgi:predicted nuclease of predicted toxin-antitoxin system
MKLLFDQNLSSDLVRKLSDLFPMSVHVKVLGMMEAEDAKIWSYASENGFVIVSKDTDFQQRSLVFGAPPKVIWLKVGNCCTSRIERLLRDHSVELYTFEADSLQTLLVLS